MWELTLDQFTEDTIDGHKVYIFTKRIGSRSEGSKTKQGGIKFIAYEPVHMPLFDVTLVGGRVNLYQMYKKILEIRPQTESKRLFLQIKRGSMKPYEFFKKQNLGKGFFDRAMKTMCLEAGFTGSGHNEYCTNHGSRGTMITFLVEAGHPDCSIILRSGHADATTVTRYHNLRGAEGLRQQISILEGKKDEETFITPLKRQ